MNLLPDAPPQDSSDTALYNIGVVTRITGISMATLRAWERRYNFPEAKRTTGGHRLYSEKDIMRLRWVKSCIEEGMQTSQAVNALRHLETLEQVIDKPSPFKVDIHENETKTHSVFTHYQNLLFNALIQRNLSLADQLLGEALVISSPENIILSIIGPTMSMVGDAWKDQKISVATEHYITHFLRQRLLMWMISGPPPQNKPPIVLACAPNEYHEGSLLMLGALLRRRLLPVAYLGQAVPLPDLASFIRVTKPTAVVIVAMTENTATELINWPNFMPEVSQSNKPFICFGGKVFEDKPDWRVRIPGIFLGTTIQQGLDNLEKIMSQTH